MCVCVVYREGVLVPYRDEWPRLFAAEMENLKRVLAPWLSGEIHHVGSTAVPGLAAKPIIDMLAEVKSLKDAWEAREPLAALGYVYGEHRPEALWFHKPGEGGWVEQTHALHLTEPGSDLWRERIAFRDALRADPQLAAAYERWKLDHAANPTDAAPYTASKTAFVTSVLAQNGIAVRSDPERLTAAALAAQTR